MNVGSIVILKKPLLGNPVHSLGVCYELYGKNGASFIFENGNYDGFSEEEQNIFLHEVAFCEILSNYKFSNVMRLSDDFRNGTFSSLFELDDSFKQACIKTLREDKIDSII